jgi:hypothetical protein
MSTRAVYTFKDDHQVIHVYKHYDGYPEGGLGAINNAKRLAWELPRFEADEFAAAFVAANKVNSGDVRLIPQGIMNPLDFASDAEFHYIVSVDAGELSVTVFETDGNLVFKGLLSEALRHYEVAA